MEVTVTEAVIVALMDRSDFLKQGSEANGRRGMSTSRTARECRDLRNVTKRPCYGTDLRYRHVPERILENADLGMSALRFDLKVC
jgi:hypothetical protein